MSLRMRRLAGSLTLGLGAAFMVIGMHRGEAEIVLKKAIYICLECIGIG